MHFSLKPECSYLSDSDEEIMNNLNRSDYTPVSMLSYTKREQQQIRILYSRYIHPLNQFLASQYTKNKRYMDNRRPTIYQAMHTILIWHNAFMEYQGMNAEKAAELFWSNIDACDEKRTLLKIMFNKVL